ncbi:prolipoprotein diacylglyceryl transferase [Filifactor villosus]|uniref:Phosphatidylglycerol--prolipoprotein diacylglyceryl transferase n=1 Tax=Filifactor villosus TaxID=29374 RepID=A0ABV9QNL3_9FIRM
MDPTAFTIFNIEVKWYALLITGSMLLGMALLLRQAKKEGFVGDHLLDVFLYALPLAIIGARTYYVLFHFEEYRGDLFEMINIRGGGLAIHGALLGAFAGGWIAVKKHRLQLLKTMDIFSPYVILGQAIGRWGNFINQEAHGGPTDLPWGIMVDGVKVHPTFLYESLWNIAIFILLLSVRKKKDFDGKMTAIYLIGYSIGRFFIEGLRTDSLMLGPLRAAQVISLIFIVIGALLWRKNKDRGVGEAYVTK